MFGYIYETTNLINGKKYIGKHKSSKFDNNYLGSGTYLKNAIKKYGKENFKVIILEEIKDFDNNEEGLKYLSEREMFYICNDNFNATKDINYYNVSYGGEKEGWNYDSSGKNNPMYNHIYTEEQIEHIKQGAKNRITTAEGRLAISKGHIGLKHSEETKKKISNSNKNKKLSQKHKEKISEKQWCKLNKTCWINKNSINKRIKLEELDLYLQQGWTKGRLYDISGENNPMCGKHLSEETKKKISDSEKGKIISKETKNKISIARKQYFERRHTQI